MTAPHHHGHEQGRYPDQRVPEWAVELYNRVSAVEAKSERHEHEQFETNQRLDTLMTDIQTAKADVEAALAKQAQDIVDLKAKLDAGASLDPESQAAIDALEADAQAILNPAPAAGAPAPGDPGAGDPAPADPSAPADPTAPVADPSAPPADTSTDGSTPTA